MLEAKLYMLTKDHRVSQVKMWPLVTRTSGPLLFDFSYLLGFMRVNLLCDSEGNEVRPKTTKGSQNVY